MHEEGVALAREVVVVTEADGGAAIGGVDGFAVYVEPFADLFEDTNGFFGYGAVGFWADVEQVVAALLSAGGEVVDYALRGLPFGVVFLPAPAEVHCVAGFPRTLGGFDLVLGRRKVSRQAVA